MEWRQLHKRLNCGAKTLILKVKQRLHSFSKNTSQQTPTTKDKGGSQTLEELLLSAGHSSINNVAVTKWSYKCYQLSVSNLLFHLCAYCFPTLSWQHGAGAHKHTMKGCQKWERGETGGEWVFVSVQRSLQGSHVPSIDSLVVIIRSGGFVLFTIVALRRQQHTKHIHTHMYAPTHTSMHKHTQRCMPFLFFKFLSVTLLPDFITVLVKFLSSYYANITITSSRGSHTLG